MAESTMTEARVAAGVTVPVSPARVPAGRVGMWWFLSSEVAVFGGLIAAFVLNKMRHPEWATDAAHTWFEIGAINTAVLLTSSLTVVLAHAAAKQEKRAVVLRNLGITLALGVLFLVFKGVEYSHEFHQGIGPGTNLFWSFYFLMTGLHALHVIAGLVAITTVMVAVARGEHFYRVETVGLYWHFVDIVWIFLFPLLYLVQ
ncbi:MAG: cytochrome c oxidase subunit 3 [Candidatus Latescibacterota bacterium]|nr:MAG: cytochrome c oxidase subunit 3 [Candidatus Latescibacterota bacterium]